MARTRLSRDEIRERIAQTYHKVFSSHTGKSELPPTNEDSVLLETGLDSLGFAILVVTLEDEFGYDPFSLSKEPYYPRTFGEFVNYYYTNQP